jgi:hypothetical protein
MSLYFVIIKPREDRIMRITFLTLFVLTASMHEDNSTNSTNLVVVDLHMCMLVVNEDGKISKLTCMDHQIIVCLQQMIFRSIMIKGLWWF